jgi:serine/threonine protein kinase/predicted negative regulator of RcsB-dependent stress response
MNSGEWQIIKQAFNTIIDLSVNERAEALEKYDESIRYEVEKLISASEEAEDFIVEPAFVEAGFNEVDETDCYVGKQIDAYKIIKEIGHGGMGTVYLAARRDDFEKRVALKLIKRGMDTNSVLKRFMMERQILARLEHPFIANLFDGGSTADGLPFLVMEYVEGLPVTRFCAAQNLKIEDRLALFQKICAAVSFAHQNLVVHRDLKPSNILVTADGTPKLLDFGIAKLLHPDWSLDTAEATATMFRVMTPEYASPEQLRGLPVTTASDVYSLGVVLYELLTGERPYKIDSRLPEEAAQVVLTEEPVKPSSAVSRQWRESWAVTGKTNIDEPPTTNNEPTKNPKSQIPNPKSLRGDLDNIILKALRKEPERRYQSVQEFSDDIRRHLTGLPVTATADSRIYRLKKFVKRHRAGVFAGLFVFFSLLTGISVAIWQAVEARKERAKAEQHFNDVRKLTNSFLFEFHDAIQDLQGATPAREMTVKKALEYLDILAREQSSDLSLQFELATAYAKVAKIQSYPGASSLGDTSGSITSHRKAIEILEKLLEMKPNNREYQQELALNYKSLAFIYEISGEADLNYSSNQSALNLFQNLVSSDDTDVNSKLELSDCHKSLGDATASKGDLEKAMQSYRQTLEMSESVLRFQPDNKKAKTMIMVASDAIGTTLGNPNFTNLGDTDAALQAHRRQLDVCNEMLAADPQSQSLQSTKAFTLKVIGEVQTARKEWKEALKSYQQSLEIQENLVKTDVKDAFANGRLAYLLTNLGEALANTDQLAGALNQHNRAIEILEKLVETDKENSALVLSLNRSYQKKGDALVIFGRPDEALSFYHKALKSNEEIAAQDLNNMDMRLQLANDYLQIARVHVSLAAKASDKKQAYWQEARRRFEQSKNVFLDMQAHNLRTPPITDVLTEISRQIAVCDEKLSGR